MAYDVFQSRGPSVSLSLFGDAAAQGTNIGKAVPSVTSSIIQGAKEGFTYAQEYEGKQIQNENNAAIADINRQKADSYQENEQLDQQEQEARIAKMEEETAQLQDSTAKRLKEIETKNKLAKAENEALIIDAFDAISVEKGGNLDTGLRILTTPKLQSVFAQDPKSGLEFINQLEMMGGPKDVLAPFKKQYESSLYKQSQEKTLAEQADAEAQKGLLKEKQVAAGRYTDSIKAGKYPEYAKDGDLAGVKLERSNEKPTYNLVAPDGRVLAEDIVSKDGYETELRKLNGAKAWWLDQGLTGDPGTKAQNTQPDATADPTPSPVATPTASPNANVEFRAKQRVEAVEKSYIEKGAPANAWTESLNKGRAKVSPTIPTYMTPLENVEPIPGEATNDIPGEAPRGTQAPIDESQITPLADVDTDTMALGAKPVNFKLRVDRNLRKATRQDFSYAPLQSKSLKEFTIAPETIERVNSIPELDNMPPIFKGLVAVESRGKLKAESPAGAKGLTQLMPGTAEEMGLSEDEVFDAEKNIEAGVGYYTKQFKQITQVLKNAYGKQGMIPEPDPRIILAAYNGGSKHIRQAIAAGYLTWEDMQPFLKQKKSKKAYEENSTYPDKVLMASTFFMNGKTRQDKSFINSLIAAGAIEA